MAASSRNEVLPQFVPSAYCLRCQGCCRFAQADSIWSPQLSVQEKKTLGKIRMVCDTHSGMFHCGFLDPGSNVCKVYSLRPIDCRLYPFLLNRRGAQVFLAVDPACAFIKEEKDSPQFKAFVKRLAGLCKRSRLAAAIAGNASLVQEYETVIDLVKLADSS